MRSDFVVVLEPFSNEVSGLWQALKPLLIQAFVSELSIETLHVTVLYEPARVSCHTHQNEWLENKLNIRHQAIQKLSPFFSKLGRQIGASVLMLEK